MTKRKSIRVVWRNTPSLEAKCAALRVLLRQEAAREREEAA